MKKMKKMTAIEQKTQKPAIEQTTQKPRGVFHKSKKCFCGSISLSVFLLLSRLKSCRLHSLCMCMHVESS